MSSIARKITQFSTAEINSLFTHARRIAKSPAFLLLAAERQKDFGRVLIVLSRKVGNAVERNKIRRRIKAIFYQEKIFESAYDTVLIIYKAAVRMSFDELKAAILDSYKTLR